MNRRKIQQQRSKAQVVQPISGESSTGPSTPPANGGEHIFTATAGQPSQPASEGSNGSTPVFGTPSAEVNNFTFTGLSDLPKDNALARLAKKESELNDTKDSYHNLLVERDNQIADLEKTVAALHKEIKQIRNEKDDFEQEINSYKDTASDATAAQTKAEKELEKQKGLSDHDREMQQKYQQEAEEKNKTIDTITRIKDTYKEKVAELQATNQELHKQVDGLEEETSKLRNENAELATQNDFTNNEITQANKELEQMFQDVGRDSMDLNGYVTHIRDMMTTGSLRRQDSQASLERQLSPQKSQQEFTRSRGVSLQEQLAAVDDASSERSIPNGTDGEDEDETLTDLGLGRPLTDYDMLVQLQNQEQKINELKAENEQLRIKAEEYDATTKAAAEIPALSFSENTSVDTEPIQPPKPASVTQVGSQTEDLKGLFQDDAAVAEPASTINHYPAVETAPVSPANGRKYKIVLDEAPSFGELWQRIPYFYKILLLITLALYVILFANIVTERYIWLANNDMTRRQVIRMGGEGYGWWAPIAPFLEALDYYVGVDSSPMG